MGKRLISAKELERQIKEAFKDNPYAMGQMLRWIRKQPTVDAVEVVRCKDCKKCGVLEHIGKLYCKEPMGCLGCVQTEPNNFCSYGERKDNA
jgi:hypothetical protein